MKGVRNLDGYRFRILRDNNLYDVVCLSDMSDKEIDKVLSTMDKSQLKALVKGLANRVYQIGDEKNVRM